MIETNLLNGAFHLHSFQNKIKQLIGFSGLFTAGSYAAGNFVTGSQTREQAHVNKHTYRKFPVR